MVNRMGELEEAQLTLEFRQFYRDMGYATTIQALYEILKAAQILNNVIIEETKKEMK